MTVQRFASSAEADRHDLAYWQAIPAEDRIELVWQLSLEQWRSQPANHTNPDVTGLSRAFIAAKGLLRHNQRS